MRRVGAYFGITERMKAARALAGITSVEDLAEKMGGQRGLKVTTLRQIEQGVRKAELRELREIAEACGLPVEFFSADLSQLAKISEDARRVIAVESVAAVERARARREGKPEGRRPLRAEGRES